MKVMIMKESEKRIDKGYFFSLDEVAAGEMQEIATQLDSCKKLAHSQGGGEVQWVKVFDFERDLFCIKVSYIFKEA